LITKEETLIKKLPVWPLRSVAIRLHGGTQVGWGHVVRHVHFGKQLISQWKVKLLFVVEGDPAILDYITSKGFDFVNFDHGVEESDVVNTVLENFPCDLVIMDMLHATEDRQLCWQSEKRGLVLFDELCRFKHRADMVVCAQLLPKYPNIDKTSGKVQYCHGVEYFVLPESFLSLREKQGERSGVLVSLGGAVPIHIYQKILQALVVCKHLNEVVTCVLGYAVSDQEVRELSEKYPKVQFLESVNNMSELMMQNRCAVLAAGFVKYEAACLGLPQILVACYDHQIPIAQIFEDKQIARFAGSVDQLDAFALRDIFDDYLNSTDAMQSMAREAMKMVDGRGASRVIEAMTEVFAY